METFPAFEIKRGSYVWAKMNKVYWPGLVIDGIKDLGKRSIKANCQWIFWFGENSFSEMPNKSIIEFSKNFSTIYKDKSNFKLKSYVNDALEAYAYTANITVAKSKLFKWAKNYNFAEDVCGIPEFIEVKIKMNAQEEQYKDLYRVSKKPANEDQKVLIRRIKNGYKNVRMCLGCYTEDASEQHPIFENGMLCKDCLIRTKLTMQHTGNDGVHYFCFVCSFVNDNAFVCSNVKCSKVICVTCVEDFCGNNEAQKIRNQDPWSCYVCKSSSNEIMQKRKNWRENVFNLSNKRNNLIIPKPLPRQRKLRVLSICDGIGSVLCVLDKLKIDVEAYYAFESDKIASNIAIKNYSTKITVLKDLRTLNKKQLKSILPIDLVVGKIPYQEVEDVNYETDFNNETFLEYFRVLMQLRTLARESLFWYFESPTIIPLKYKAEMNRVFEMDAKICDTSIQSVSDNRFIWGNLPSLTCDILFNGKSGNVRKYAKFSIKILEKMYGYPADYTYLYIYNEDQRKQVLSNTMGLTTLTNMLTFLKEYFPLKSE